MLPDTELATVNLHRSQIKLNLHIDFENLATSSETTPTLNKKADEDTESTVEHTYIIKNNNNIVEGDELADKAVVIEVDDGN